MRKSLFIVLAITGNILFSGLPLGAITADELMQEVAAQKGVFSLPPLPYGYDALEPTIDARTLDIHYNRHHRAYVDGLNKAIKGTPWENLTLDELFAQISKLPIAIRHNAGGHFGHSFYWSAMIGPNQNSGMSERLKNELIKNFGSIESFKQEFEKSGIARFGSGWVWLVKIPDGSLKICSTPNQDNPLMDITEVKGKPVLTCDVWEHAYYLKYLNRRDSYLSAFWPVVDWPRVEKLIFEEKMQ